MIVCVHSLFSFSYVMQWVHWCAIGVTLVAIASPMGFPWGSCGVVGARGGRVGVRVGLRVTGLGQGPVKVRVRFTFVPKT